MKYCVAAIAAISIMLLTNCANTQPAENPAIEFTRKQISAHAFQAAQASLSDAAYPVLRENHDQCKQKVSGLSGFELLTLNDVSKKMRPAYEAALHVQDRATVIHVVPGTPAAQAGLVMGDVIVKTGGRNVRSGK